MLGPGYGMKWRLGLRYAETIFASWADKAPADALGGFDQQAFTNDNWGIGPHGGVELDRRWKETGLGIGCRVDTGLLFGKTTQRFSDASTATANNVAFALSNDQQVPMLSAYFGLDWRPPSHPNFDFLVGYTTEYWWNVGRLSDPDMYNGNSAGEVGASGVAFRVQYNYYAHEHPTYLPDGRAEHCHQPRAAGPGRHRRMVRPPPAKRAPPIW